MKPWTIVLVVVIIALAAYAWYEQSRANSINSQWLATLTVAPSTAPQTAIYTNVSRPMGLAPLRTEPVLSVPAVSNPDPLGLLT